MKLPILDTNQTSISSVTAASSNDEKSISGTINHSICFAFIKHMVSPTNKYLHVWIQDLTSYHTKTTEFTDEYVRDIIKNFNPILSHDISLGFEIDTIRRHHLVFDTNKTHGVILLGLLNLFKVTTENFTLPITYCYLKDQYPELKFYQRLVLIHALFIREYINIFKTTGGQHATFNNNIQTIDGLSLKEIGKKWDKNNLFNEKDSFCYSKSFLLNGDSLKHTNQEIQQNYILQSMNYQWLPEPWAPTQKKLTKIHAEGDLLCRETVDILLNPENIKIPSKYDRQVILGQVPHVIPQAILFNVGGGLVGAGGAGAHAQGVQQMWGQWNPGQYP